MSCMAYVDLNPVRAGMEDNLVDSDFTAIQQRLFDYAKHKVIKKPEEKRLVRRVAKQRELKTELELEKIPEAPFVRVHFLKQVNRTTIQRCITGLINGIYPLVTAVFCDCTNGQGVARGIQRQCASKQIAFVGI